MLLEDGKKEDFPISESFIPLIPTKFNHVNLTSGGNHDFWQESSMLRSGAPTDHRCYSLMKADEMSMMSRVHGSEWHPRLKIT